MGTLPVPSSHIQWNILIPLCWNRTGSCPPTGSRGLLWWFRQSLGQTHSWVTSHSSHILDMSSQRGVAACCILKECAPMQPLVTAQGQVRGAPFGNVADLWLLYWLSFHPLTWSGLFRMCREYQHFRGRGGFFHSNTRDMYQHLCHRVEIML